MSYSSTENLNPTVVRPTEAKPGAQDTHPLDSVTETEILNVSVAGKLVGVAVQVTVAPTGTPSAKLKINIDGAGYEDVMPLYAAGVAWGALAQAFALVGDGDAIGDRVVLWLNLDFETSCVVALETTSAGSAGELSGAALYSQEL